MRYTHVSGNEIEKIYSMFVLMNQLKDLKSEKYIKSIMKRYDFIASVFNYSVETVRKIFQKTLTYKVLDKENMFIKMNITILIFI